MTPEQAPKEITEYWSPSEGCLYIDRASGDPKDTVAVTYIRSDRVELMVRLAVLEERAKHSFGLVLNGTDALQMRINNLKEQLQ